MVLHMHLPQKRNHWYEDYERCSNWWYQTQYLASFTLDDVLVLTLDYLLSLQINVMSAEDEYKILSSVWYYLSLLFTKKCMWSRNKVKKKKIADPLHNKGRLFKVYQPRDISQQRYIQEFQLH